MYTHLQLTVPLHISHTTITYTLIIAYLSIFLSSLKAILVEVDLPNISDVRRDQNECTEGHSRGYGLGTWLP